MIRAFVVCTRTDIASENDMDFVSFVVSDGFKTDFSLFSCNGF